jgi:hypothetical protein
MGGMRDDAQTVAYAGSEDELAALLSGAGLSRGDIDTVVEGLGEEGLDALQDAVYGAPVGLVLLASLERLGPDPLTQETVLAGWVERGIRVYSQAEPDLGASDPARRDIRTLVGSIDEYGKIPWVP